MIRRLGICILTVAVIAGIGGLLGHPPAFLDTVSGATALPGNTQKELDGTYLLGVSGDTARMPDSGVAEPIYEVAGGGSTPAPPGDGLSFTISVREDEEAIVQYAHHLAEALFRYGFDVAVRTYDNTHFRSRLYAGYYDVFLCPANYMDRELLGEVTLFELDGATMNRSLDD